MFIKVKWFKFILLFSITALLSSILPACSSKSVKGLDDGPEIKNLEPARLTFYFPGLMPNDSRLVLDEIEKQCKGTLNIKLDFKWVDGFNYPSRIIQLLSSGQPMDAFMCGTPQFPQDNDYAKLFREGHVKDLTDILPKYAPKLMKGYEELGELEYMKVDRRVALLPSLLPKIAPTNFYLDNELKEKYGIESIKTLEDFDKIIYKIKENEQNFSPIFISNNDSIDYFARMYNYCILDSLERLVYKFDDPQMKVIPWEQTPEYRNIMSLLTKWNKDGINYGYSKDKTYSAAIICNDVNINEGVVDYNLDGLEQKFYVFRPYSCNVAQRENPIGLLTFNGAVAFNAKSENIERGLMFLNWIQESKRNYDLFMYGIKDKHYFIKEGKIVPVPSTKEKRNGYFGWFGSGIFSNISMEGTEIEAFEYKDQLIKKTKYAPHEGFKPDYTNIKEQADAREKKYRISQPMDYSTVSVTNKELEDKIEEIRKEGTNVVVAEVQRQLDEWRKKNK